MLSYFNNPNFALGYTLVSFFLIILLERTMVMQKRDSFFCQMNMIMLMILGLIFRAVMM